MTALAKTFNYLPFLNSAIKFNLNKDCKTQQKNKRISSQNTIYKRKQMNQASKHLPSTSITGGRMHTRSYARAVIEGKRIEEAVKAGIDDEFILAEAENEADAIKMAEAKMIEAADEAEAKHVEKKNKKKQKKLML